MRLFLTGNAKLETWNIAPLARRNSKFENRKSELRAAGTANTAAWKRRGGAAGFTLLEVLIAMTILAITLVALSRSQSQSVSVSGESRAMTTLCLLANAKMAETETQETLTGTIQTGDFGTDFPNYAWQVKVSDTDTQNFKKIEVVTHDKRKSREKGYRLVLYKYSPT